MSDKRQKTTKTAKILALIPIVALAAACSGTAPAGPSAVGSSALPGDNASAAKSATKPRHLCDAITGIDLKLADATSRSVLWVEASYLYINDTGGFAACPAPIWSSDRDGLIVDAANPFRAGLPRSLQGTATLKAEGPNGVHAGIVVKLSDSDNDNDNCHNIVAVILSLLPSLDDGVVTVQASYAFFGDTPDNCSEPPTFTASRGQRSDSPNAFQVRIEADSTVKTTVAAVAPNGVEAKITF